MKQMEDRVQFLKFLNPVRRQLLFEMILKEVQLLLAFAGAVCFLLLLTARFIVIPFLSYYFYSAMFLLIIVFIFKTWRNRPGLSEAASVYNQFVPDDRVTTGFSFLNDEGVVAQLQLADAVKQMKK